MLPWSVAFAVTFVASLMLTPAARAAAQRLGVVDHPDGKRKLQAKAVPLWGGVAVYLALLFGLLVIRHGPFDTSEALDKLTLVIGIAAGFVCILGCIDDGWDVRARFKLILQIVSVMPIVIAGYWVDRLVLFNYPIELGWMGIPLTIMWLVGCINALNLLDGMDGLAALIGVSTAIMMAIIAASIGHPHVALVAIVFAGALAGFLVYNLPPASIYLGDSGSMVIGLVVGILGIQGAMKTSATLAITAPAVVMSIPLLDTLLAIVRRRLTGRPIDAADRGHIHHRLLDLGLSNWQALCIILALCVATGAAAAAATFFRSDALAWVVTLSIVVLLVRLRAFGHHELSLIKRSVANGLAGLVNGLLASTRSSRRGSPNKLSEMTFDEAWAVLVDEVLDWQASFLEMEIRQLGQPCARHVWGEQGESGPSRFQWTLEMSFPGAGGTVCTLRVTGADDDSARPWYLIRVAMILRAFGRHWASHPFNVPPGAVMPPSRPTSPGEGESETWRDAA